MSTAEIPDGYMVPLVDEGTFALATPTMDVIKDDVMSEIVADAGGVTTSGSVIQLGPEGAMPADIGTSGIVGGGASPHYENVIGGDTSKVNTAASNIPVGGPGTGVGDLTAPDGNWNWLWGGYDNVVNGWACQIHGYHCKVEVGANHVTIAGGSIHVVDAGVAYATIGGGTGNRCTGQASVIAGGSTNHASGNYSVIGGGQNNIASGAAAIISGGSSNQASASNSVVGGGTNNNASAVSATVAGGQFNAASGVAAFVSGRENTASGPAATAQGRDALSTYHGGYAHGAGQFAAKGDAQYQRVIMRTQTTDATPKVMTLDNISARLVMPADTTWAFSIVVVARRTDANDESAGYKIEGVIDRSTASASTTALVGTPVVTVLGEDIMAWSALASASTGFGSLDITVAGEAAKTIRWVATIELTCVTG